MSWAYRLLVPLLLLGLVGGGIWFLTGHFVKNSVWVPDLRIKIASRRTKELFEFAQKANVIQFDVSTGIYGHDACEALYDAPNIHTKGNLSDSEVRRALQELCETKFGEDIRNELTLWNSSFRFLGIRDNSNKRRVCDDNLPIKVSVILKGCLISTWTVERLDPGSGKTTANQTGLDSPPHRPFAFIAKRGGSFFADWINVSGVQPTNAGIGNRFVLSSVIEGNGDDIFVDLVGDLRALEVAGKTLINDNDGRKSTFSGKAVGRQTIRLDRLCDDDAPALRRQPRRGSSRCSRAQNNGWPYSYRLTIKGLAKSATLPVSITADFARNLPPDLIEYLAPGQSKQRRSVSLQRTAHIRVRCEDGPTRPCSHSWVAPERVETSERKAFELILSDGGVLIDREGSTTKAAFDLGLVDMVGYSPSDNGSLSAGLNSKLLEDDSRFHLTIDGRVQKISLEVLRAVLKRKNKSSYQQRKSRAAIVIMDAGDDPSTRGDILASISTPVFQQYVNVWDIVAMAEGGGADNALAGNAWRSTDVHSTPGSSFKPITGYVAIEEGEKDPDIADLVVGAIPPAEAKVLLGGSAKGRGLVVKSRGSKNLSLTGFSKATKAPSDSKCPSARGKGSQMSVCEATIVSSNAWFAGMNLKMNADFIGSQDGGAQSPSAIAIGRLFPLLTRADRIKGNCSKCLDLTWGSVRSAHKLRAEPIDIAYVSKEFGGRIDYATNSYGQGTRASVIAMTSLYASLGSGFVVSPRILKEGIVPPLSTTGAPVPSTKSDFADRAMASLKAGLKGVVASDYGTAKRAFTGARRNHTYGKTGSADSGSGEATSRGFPNSVSFSGWIEPHGNITRRLAFTCWISHQRPGNFGGTICAPVLDEILKKLPKLDP